MMNCGMKIALKPMNHRAAPTRALGVLDIFHVLERLWHLEQVLDIGEVIRMVHI